MSIVPMLIDHCSPTLASLKCGSLFSVTPEDMAQTRREAQALSDALAPKGLAIRVIDSEATGARCAISIAPASSAACSRAKRKALSSPGATCLRVEPPDRLLCARLAQGGAFPHEIGLFLGYPIDDVVAFIANKGRNCLCCGCWKCYTDAEAARRRFAGSASAPASIAPVRLRKNARSVGRGRMTPKAEGVHFDCSGEIPVI